MGETPLMPKPYGVERVNGRLASFDKTFAYVRIKGERLVTLPVSHRGTVATDGQGPIALCMNGDRYQDIPTGTPIALDLVFNHEGQNPIPGPWAPVHQPGKKTTVK